MRVPFSSIEHDEYTDARYRGHPFTGTAFHPEEGKPTEECDFVGGQLHGMRREYRADGRLIWEARYEDGVASGSSLQYFEDGRVRSIALYDSGELVETLNSIKKA